VYLTGCMNNVCACVLSTALQIKCRDYYHNCHHYHHHHQQQQQQQQVKPFQACSVFMGAGLSVFFFVDPRSFLPVEVHSYAKLGMRVSFILNKCHVFLSVCLSASVSHSNSCPCTRHEDTSCALSGRDME